uniref:Uncharacterized protein n=1 Tax=Panagrolaimus sp. ES5 TaxID=591445 RepID=A0AC34EZT4_9BILA
MSITLRGVPMVRDVELSSAKAIQKILPDPDKLFTLILKVVSIGEPKNTKYGINQMLRVKFEGGDNTPVFASVFGDDYVKLIPELIPVGAVVKIVFPAFPPYRQLEQTNVKFEIRVNGKCTIGRPDI